MKALENGTTSQNPFVDDEIRAKWREMDEREAAYRAARDAKRLLALMSYLHLFFFSFEFSVLP